MKHWILYNPFAGSEKCKVKAQELFEKYEEAELIDVTKMESLSELIAKKAEGDRIILCGGDGTLNHFVNMPRIEEIADDLYFCAVGSGNDFSNDVGMSDEKEPFHIASYMKNLAKAEIKGETYHFVNGLGLGIDGFCCQIANAMHKKGKKISYALIALIGLLFGFKPADAVISVDGKEYRYKRVWMATTMKGRYFGGGVEIIPDQDRMDSEGNVSIIVAHDVSRLRALTAFPLILKGHYKMFPKIVAVLKGKEISVSYVQPEPLQIDGETILDVESYTVRT